MSLFLKGKLIVHESNIAIDQIYSMDNPNGVERTLSTRHQFSGPVLIQVDHLKWLIDRKVRKPFL